MSRPEQFRQPGLLGGLILGYLAALGAGTLAFWGYPLITALANGRQPFPLLAMSGIGTEIVAILWFLLVTLMIMFYLTVLPVAVTIAVAVRFRIINVLYYLATSQAIALFVAWLIKPAATMLSETPEQRPEVYVSAAIGGLVCWWVGVGRARGAGRRGEINEEDTI
jgi:Na+/phosphate symporter